MTIQEYLSLIEKKFHYLFSDFGFKLSYAKEFRSGNNSIGLESENFRIFFQQERGGFSIWIGTLNSSFDNENDGWISIYNLMVFLLNREIDWKILEKSPYQERVDNMFTITANEFAPLCKQVVEMFKSPENVAQWKPDYDQFIKNIVNRN
jgi:hypothetical protein